ncbi:MAG: FAD-binding oxidoreductase [Candidatus Dormibacteraeota bacterium]|nr:FAD-binding oxidoreductase [Candidatus Dormibacteraeota bacterium]
MTSYDVVVVGGGVVGASTAAALSESGLSTAAVHAGHQLPSATEASGGLVRAYDSDSETRRLALQSYEMLWGQPGDRRNRCGFQETGSVVCLSQQELVDLSAVLADLARHGIATEILTASDVSRRWPVLGGAGIEAALWEPGGGYAAPPATATTLLQEARDRGVVEVSNCRVRRLLRSRERVVGVETDLGQILARAVVVAAGCGSAALLPPEIAGELLTKRIRYALVAHPARPLPTLVDSVTGMWGRPYDEGRLLVGRPDADWNVQPASGRHITEQQWEYIRAGGATRWPELAGAALVGARTGTDLYRRRGPLLGAVSSCPGLVVATAWSGGGFKTAPAAGRTAAKAAMAIVAGRPSC